MILGKKYSQIRLGMFIFLFFRRFTFFRAMEEIWKRLCGHRLSEATQPWPTVQLRARPTEVVCPKNKISSHYPVWMCTSVCW